jgi:hypothetical protein
MPITLTYLLISYTFCDQAFDLCHRLRQYDQPRHFKGVIEFSNDW